MALTDEEALVYETMNEHKHIRRPFQGTVVHNCTCGQWAGPIHQKHLAHKVVEALKKKGYMS